MGCGLHGSMLPLRPQGDCSPGDGSETLYPPSPGPAGRPAADVEQRQLLLGRGLAEVAHKGGGVVHHLHHMIRSGICM